MKYTKALADNIQKRFNNDNMGILVCFDNFSPTAIPSPDTESNLFKDYGKTEINKIADFFYQEQEEKELDALKTKLKAEWKLFKYVLVTWKALDIPKERTAMEYALMRLFQQKHEYSYFYPQILSLAEIILSCPISNAWPERGASCVKRVKTRFRSRMKNDMLNCLMHVRINGPTPGSKAADSIIAKSLKTWEGLKKRRKYYSKPCLQQTLSSTKGSVKVMANASCQTEETTNTDTPLPEIVPGDTTVDAACAEADKIEEATPTDWEEANTDVESSDGETSLFDVQSSDLETNNNVSEEDSEPTQSAAECNIQGGGPLGLHGGVLTDRLVQEELQEATRALCLGDSDGDSGVESEFDEDDDWF